MENKKTSFELLQEILNDISKSKEQTNKAKGKDCVLLIGDTGVGKSTLMNALMSGSQNLRVIKIEKFTKSGKKYYQEVIQVIKDIKDQKGVLFKIGHGAGTSMTKHPQIILSEEVAYCDCPGFGDTQGEGRQIVNSIAIKTILQQAKSIKILLAMSEQTLTSTSGRGKAVRNVLSTLTTIFKGHIISIGSKNRLDSVLPLILKPKPNCCVELIRENLIEAVKNDKDRILQPFAETLSEKLSIMDPLQRTEMFQDSIEIFELKDKIKSMPSLINSDFDDPISAQSISNISCLFHQIQMDIKKLIDNNQFSRANQQIEKLSALSKIGFKLVDGYHKNALKYKELKQQSIRDQAEKDEQARRNRQLQREIYNKRQEVIKKEQQKAKAIKQAEEKIARNKQYLKMKDQLQSEISELQSDVRQLKSQISSLRSKAKQSESSIINSLGRGAAYVHTLTNYVNPGAWLGSLLDDKNENKIRYLHQFQGATVWDHEIYRRQADQIDQNVRRKQEIIKEKKQELSELKQQIYR